MPKSAVGMTFQKLTVIESANGKFLCQCECGGQIEMARHTWPRKTKWACQACMDWDAYVRSLQIDRKLLARISEADATIIMRRYIRHVRLCFRDQVQATSWETFVREILSDPEGVAEPAAPSFAERLTRATQQGYDVYVSPTMGIGV